MRKLLSMLTIAALAIGMTTGCEKKAEDKAEAVAEAKDNLAETKKEANAEVAEAKKEVKEAKAAAGGADAIVGKWTIDLEATMAEDPKMKDMPQEQKDQAMKAAAAFLSNMSFEFTKDGKAIAKMGDKEEAGAYTVKSVAGDTLTIEMKQGEGDAAKTEEMQVKVMGDKLLMSQGPQKFVLKKL